MKDTDERKREKSDMRWQRDKLVKGFCCSNIPILEAFTVGKRLFYSIYVYTLSYVLNMTNALPLCLYADGNSDGNIWQNSQPKTDFTI